MLQIAGNSDVPLMTTFSDNFKFEKGPVTAVPTWFAQNTNLVIYPNPCSDELHVFVPNQSYQFAQVINLSGQLIIQQEIVSDQTQIDTRQLKNGMYLLKVKRDEKIITQKFIKN